MAVSLAAVKSSVYAIQLGLLEGIASDDQLQAAGKVLTQSEYADVVTERTIVNLCGYPLCTHPLPGSFPHKGRYHISLREHKVYDLRETRLFCSSDCLVSSQSFAASLPSERDHTQKTLELAAAFHSLRDVNGHHEPSSSAVKIGEATCTPAPKQEPIPLCAEMENGEDVPTTTGTLAMENGEDIPACVHKLEMDPPSVPAEESATKQSSGSFLLIHEQSEIEVDDFCIAGPSNAIEGYIPMRELHRKKLTNHDKEEMSAFTSRCEPEEKCVDILRMKERETNGFRKKKQVSASKVKDTDIEASSGLDTIFSSCILLDQAKATTSAAGCLTEPANSCGPAFTSRIMMDDKASTQDLGRCGPKKKQNRVSWADHNNLSLIEESSISSSKRTTKDFGDARAHVEDRDQGPMSGFLSHGNVDVVLEHKNGQLNDFQNVNLECAKALVAALTEAAEAVAHGEADSSEAVARAGISILPNDEMPPNYLLDHLEKKSEKGFADDVEDVDLKDCWYSTSPKDFKPELSTFGTLWMALDGWISAASIAYVYGRDVNEEDDFSFINGKEYPRQVIIPNGVSAEIERTFAGCISRALSGLVESLRIPIPLSTLESSLGRFMRTMSFVSALPPFSSKQWQLVVLLFLDALSIHRLPALRTRFSSGRHVLQKVLDSSNITEAEYEVFRDLVLPMGILPEFAAHCGG